MAKEIDISIDNDLVIANPKFKHKDIRHHTREELGTKEISEDTNGKQYKM